MYTESADKGYASAPSSIGGTKDLGTAPGNATWSHCSLASAQYLEEVTYYCELAWLVSMGEYIVYGM